MWPVNLLAFHPVYIACVCLCTAVTDPCTDTIHSHQQAGTDGIDLGPHSKEAVICFQGCFGYQIEHMEGVKNVEEIVKVPMRLTQGSSLIFLV